MTSQQALIVIGLILSLGAGLMPLRSVEQGDGAARAACIWRDILMGRRHSVDPLRAPDGTAAAHVYWIPHLCWAAVTYARVSSWGGAQLTRCRTGARYPDSMPPPTDGILETSLYVDDIRRSAEFYLRVFGFPVISDFGDQRGCALQAGPQQVLLLFRKGASVAITSPHDGDGELHLAFAIPASALSRWEAWLAENAIAVEERKEWERGGVSLYFRDPDRHLLEVVTPGLWSIY